MYNVTSVKEAGAIVAALEDIKNAMEGGYPEPTSATDGQVLTADGDGGASWEDPSGGLPASTYEDEGKSLLVDQNGDAEWGYPAGLVPDPTLASEGDILAINNQGSPAWTTPSSGGGLPSQSESTDGQFLRSVYDDKSGTSEAEWASINVRQVPSAVAASAGDVLTADGNGDYAWAAPSGGGGNSGIQFITGTISGDMDDKEGIYYAGVSGLSVNSLTPGTYMAHFSTPAAGAFDADSLAGASSMRFGYNLSNYMVEATYTIYPISVELRKYDTPVDYSFCVPTYADRSNSVYNQKYIQYLCDTSKLSSGANYVLDVNCIIVVTAVE